MMDSTFDLSVPAPGERMIRASALSDELRVLAEAVLDDIEWDEGGGCRYGCSIGGQPALIALVERGEHAPECPVTVARTVLDGVPGSEAAEGSATH